MLTGLRGIVREYGASGFPIALLKQYLASRFEWESLDFGDEEMEDLADTGYWDYRVFLLLSLLFPNMDFIKQYHVDHIFPAAAFTSDALRTAGVPDEEHDGILQHDEWPCRIFNYSKDQRTLRNEADVSGQMV